MLSLIYSTGHYNNIHTVNVTVTKLQESMIVIEILCIQSLLEIIMQLECILHLVL